MTQTLQAGRLGEGGVRLIDAVTAHHLEDVRSALAHDEVGTPIAARAELAAELVLASARGALARIHIALLPLPLVHCAAGDQAANKEGDPREVADEHRVL